MGALTAIANYSRLQLTLAAGAVILSATFLDRLYQGEVLWSLILAWVGFGLSFLFSLLVHGAHIKHLIENDLVIKRGERMELWSLIQTVFLIIGIAAFAYFAVANVTADNPVAAVGSSAS